MPPLSAAASDAAPAPAPATSAATPGKPLRVLLWAPAGSGLHYSGPGMSAYRMYSRAPRERFEISLAHGAPGHEEYPLFRDQAFISENREGFLSQLRFTLRGKQWMRRHARRFDIVHGLQAFHSTVAPCAVAQALGVPAVVKLTMHGLELSDKTGLRGLLGIAKRRREMLARMQGLIAISSAIAADLRAIGVPDRRIARIPNGVDDEQFRPVLDEAQRRSARQALGWPERPTVIFVGSIIERKRPHLLVEAMSALRRKGIEAQAAFVGPHQQPEYLESMRQRARALGVAEQLTWVGFTADVAPLYRAADCFVLPSANEGLPNAMLEAMASGLPAVGTPISGITDLLGDGQAGRLVDADGDSLAEALGPLLADGTLRDREGRAARSLIERRYGVGVVLAAHERLFRTVLAGGDPCEASIDLPERPAG